MNTSNYFKASKLEKNKKVKTAKQLLKSGHTKMETQRIINKKFKLNRAENASTGRYVRVASNLLDEKINKFL